MQTYFERKEYVKKEDKRLRLNTDRGMNLHRFTDLKYKNGALTLSKDKLQKYTGDYDRVPIKKESKNIKKRSYEDIMKQRSENPEYATGKKYKRSKGSQKKLVKRSRGG